MLIPLLLNNLLTATNTSYSGSTTDSVAITDSTSGALVAAGSTTDSLAVTDVESALLVAVGSITDSLALTDSTSGVLVTAGTIAESLVVTDSVSGALARPGDITDSLAITDSLSGIITKDGSVTDSLAVTDSLSGAAVLAGSLTDSLAITDSLSGVEINGGSLTDSLAITDSASGAAALGGTLGSESLALTDSFSGVIIPAGSLSGDIAETLTLTDSVSGGAVFNCTIAESLALTDSMSGQGGSDVATGGPTTSGVPGGRPRAPRVAVRIDGELYVGTYAEISELVASLGERDAFAEIDAPVAPTKRVAKARARKAAGRFDKALQVIDVGVETDLGIDPAPVAQRDLREDYLRAYAAAMLVAYQQAEERARLEIQRREQEIEDDDAEAIEAILELI